MDRIQHNIQFAIETLSELRDERDKADEVELAINIAIGVMKQNEFLTSLVIEMADVFCEYGCEFSDCKNCKIYKLTKGVDNVLETIDEKTDKLIDAINNRGDKSE